MRARTHTHARAHLAA